MSVNTLQTHTLIAIKRPLLWVLSFTVIICIILILLKFSFEYGRNTAGFDSADSAEYINLL